MTAPPNPPQRIPGYDLAQPTEADAVAALTRVFGKERGAAAWADACRAAQVPLGRVATDALGRAADALADQGKACASIARSIRIRLATYANMSARRAALAEGARP